ncbi:hypothetical protein CHH28_10075 [Bacterioplanes sanyensis]|uniref:Transmembrane protein n=1 Tax=Bacterioplanes sanyensis TaxID=1249553 RepID=A0A222FLA7_9GAMM|nr:hypothetical protein [Bacterioplanes sanyensis]ASP39003.1 hypothetical protein CHH28_10075 [Bacterioplanes sanyensis]
MIVPKYWSEAQQTAPVANGQRTIKRFGWSDSSQQAAEQHAQQRLAEALETLAATGSVRRMDHKVAYNSTEGLPIREEVIANYDDIVISRNAYGALCLNTPSVLFADIDFDPHHGGLTLPWLLPLVIGLGLSWVFAPDSTGWLLGLGITLVISLISWLLAKRKKVEQRRGEGERQLENIRAFSQRYPELHLRIYRTPAGYRVLCMNELFDPRSDRAQQLLKELHCDPLYSQLCFNQQCFRARVSPKPWRIGMQRMQPASGVWPIKAERMPQRSAWVQQYEQTASTYAACHYVERLGAQQTLPETEQVQRLHDDYCRAQATELAMG